MLLDPKLLLLLLLLLLDPKLVPPRVGRQVPGPPGSKQNPSSAPNAWRRVVEEDVVVFPYMLPQAGVGGKDVWAHGALHHQLQLLLDPPPSTGLLVHLQNPSALEASRTLRTLEGAVSVNLSVVAPSILSA